MINWPIDVKHQNSKYSKWYEQLIANAKARTYKLEHKENHHIIPKSFGGSDEFDNRVDLTSREHYIAHALLWKMSFLTSYNQKMIMAFDFMCRRKTSKISSRLYESVRIEQSNIRKGKTYEELYTPEQIERLHNARINRVITKEGLERMCQGRAKASKAPMPNHVKKQVSERFKGRTDMIGENNPNYGRKMPEAQRQAMIVRMTGRKYSPEEAESRKQARLAHSKTCEYCEKFVTSNNYTRWHGDNCKHKKLVEALYTVL